MIIGSTKTKVQENQTLRFIAEENVINESN